MAEEFHAGICGGNWWNPSRSLFSAAAVSPCSIGGLGNDVAGFGWPSHDHIDNMVDDNNNNNNKARSNNSSGDTNNSVCESPNIAFQEVLQKPNNHQHHNNQTDHNSSPISGTVIDSTLQMIGFGLSPSDLSQPNLVRRNGRSESSDINNTMYSILQEDMGLTKWSSTSNYRQDHHIQAALSSGFPVSSASYGYNPAALLQSLFDGEAHQQPFLNNNNNRSANFLSNNYASNNNNNAWPRSISTPKHHQPGGLHFSNNTPFWNASEQVVDSGENNNSIRSGLNFPSVPQQLHNQYATPTFEQKPKCNNNTATKPNLVCNIEDQAHLDSGSSCAVKKSSSGNEQPALKRARIETPSPLPTFKVRKEKLGDRVTALQQLVSPFGKTDTASVLHEAIDYIKFLHDQVRVLSTPYMKNGAPISVQVPQQGSNKLIKNQEITPKQDLKSRGLCLVPISSTFPVANETTADFWTPTFGGTFR